MQPGQTSSSRTLRPNENGTSVIAANFQIVGNLSCNDTLNVEGMVEGNIDCHSLALGETGTVKGEVTLKQNIPRYFSGTSNLDLARRLKLMPIGTMAHEWFQGWQAVTRLADAQKAALEAWVREYRGRLGIALTDCYSMDAFVRDFSDPYFGKLYDGLRHDSGSPFEWGEKAIAMYRKLGIDPLTKTLVFSDSLTFPRMIEIYRYFQGRSKVSFGIGTNLTNDVGNTALDMVIKLVSANGKPVAKLSDEPGKSMCEDPGYLQYLASVYGIELQAAS